MKNRLFAAAALALLTLSAGAASAQVVAPSPTLRAAHIGTPLYLRIPVGSRTEPEKLRNEQNALISAQQNQSQQSQMQKVRKKR